MIVLREEKRFIFYLFFTPVNISYLLCVHHHEYLLPRYLNLCNPIRLSLDPIAAHELDLALTRFVYFPITSYQHDLCLAAI